MSGPSPYAPTYTADQPAPPRPAGKAGVFLWAIFAVNLAAPDTLWVPAAASRLDEPFSGLLFPNAGVVAAVWANLGMIFWAFVSDRLSLLGSRREGYLLLASAISLSAWIAAAFVPLAPVPLTAITLVLGAGYTMAGAANSGALVEIGQREGTTGRFAALLGGLPALAALVLYPLEEQLRRVPLVWTAGLGAAVALSIGLAVILTEDRARASASPAAPQARLATFLRGRPLWYLMALGTFGLILPEAVAADLTSRIGMGLERRWQLAIASNVAEIAVAVAYLFLCHRFGPGALLRWALLAAGLAAFAFVAADQGDVPPVPAVLAYSLPVMVGGLAHFQLCLRAAPAGHEAIGFLLLAGIPVTLGGPLRALVSAANLPFFTLVALAIAPALLAALAVPLLPAPMLAQRDADPAAPAAAP